MEYTEHKQPKLTDEKIIFACEVKINEVDSVPDDVETGKHCYTEADGFYINPDWVEPDPTNIYDIPDETYHAIINDLTSEVASNGY